MTARKKKTALKKRARPRIDLDTDLSRKHPHRRRLIREQERRRCMEELQEVLDYWGFKIATITEIVEK